MILNSTTFVARAEVPAKVLRVFILIACVVSTVGCASSGAGPVDPATDTTPSNDDVSHGWGNPTQQNAF